jgi:hypothetical protein
MMDSARNARDKIRQLDAHFRLLETAKELRRNGKTHFEGR